MLLGGRSTDLEAFRGMPIAEGLSLSTSPELLQRLLEPNPPADTRLIVGYSGWGPGQLEWELEESAWLLSDSRCDLLFQHTLSTSMWERAFALGPIPPLCLLAFVHLPFFATIPLFFVLIARSAAFSGGRPLGCCTRVGRGTLRLRS